MTIKVALDAGHPSRWRTDADGNKTPHNGAEVSGMVEADYTLSLARYTHRAIGFIGEPVDSYLPRSKPDEVVSLDDRGARAHVARCDFAIALHVNWWHTEAQRGAQAYYVPGDDIGASVADTILRCMPAPLSRVRSAFAADPSNPQDSWLEAPLAVLAPYRKREIPAALIEVGFMTHRIDFVALHDPACQFGMLAALLAGIAHARTLLPRASHAPFGGS